jgi:hypothetical protein
MIQRSGTAGLLRPVIFFFALTASLRMQAQDSFGTWNIINVSSAVNDRLGVFGEAQLRSLMFYDDFHYYEFKGGASWEFNDQLTVLGGIGRYDTYSPGDNFASPRLTREIRSWGQATLKSVMGRAKLEHRYRAEQRYTNNGYRNRFRYRIGCTVPLNRPVIEPGTIYASVWNEVFLTNRAPFFERNRAFAGLGWELNTLVTVIAGYVYQYDYRLTDETGRDFLQIGLYLDPEWNGRQSRANSGSID